MRSFRPISDAALLALLGERVQCWPGVVRVAIDGPACASPQSLAESLVEPLRASGRPVHLVRAESFWHDASLRLEHGRQDAESYLSWLDAPALRREVLDAVVESGTYLPSLRDPATNRTTREPVRRAEPDAVVIVSGDLLLGLGLPFELTVHLAMSPAARARHTPADQAWTLPALERYEAEVRPEEQADVVVRLNDPRHPAVALN
ncbi:MAG: uridine kinase [Jatrophihabitantaceae bacterium]